MLEEVIKNYGKPASAMTDCGSQFCGNASEAKKKKKKKKKKKGHQSLRKSWLSLE